MSIVRINGKNRPTTRARRYCIGCRVSIRAGALCGQCLAFSEIAARIELNAIALRTLSPWEFGR
jgi:hypothetical protein